jgi:hypothetical protein
MAALFALTWRWRNDAAAREHLRPSIASFAVVCGVFVLSLFMSHHASKPVWDALPLLAFVQFPWRFLAIAAFGSSLAAAYAVDLVGRKGGAWIRWSKAGVVSICVIAAHGAYARPAFYLYREADGTLLPGTRDTLSEWVGRDGVQDVEVIASIAHVRASGRNGTSRDDYLPRTVQVKPTREAERIVEVGNGDAREVERTGPNRYEARVEILPGGSEVILKQFHYPGWRAWIDGAPVEATPEARRGRVTIAVSEGAHDVVFEFASTALRRAAMLVSGSSAIVVATLLVVWRRRRARRGLSRRMAAASGR